MASWLPDNLRTIGAKATFHQALDAIPTFWQNHCQIETSTSNTETYTFPGFLPEPRLFLNSRQFVGARDFTFNLENNEYELSMIINRKHWEDDQTGLIKARLTEMAEVWGTFQDSLFSLLLTGGNDSGSNGFDGTTFHHDNHTSGSSLGLTFDNNLTSTAAAGTIPTPAELILQMSVIRAAFLSFTDDQGRPFNTLAAQKMRAIVHPDNEGAMYEAMHSTMVGSSGGQTTVGIQAFLEGFDVNPYQASGDSDEMYVSAVAASRKPFIYQERTKLEVVILDGENDVAKHNGVMVLTRQRFVFGYGDPRRSILFTWS